MVQLSGISLSNRREQTTPRKKASLSSLQSALTTHKTVAPTPTASIAPNSGGFRVAQKPSGKPFFKAFRRTPVTPKTPRGPAAAPSTPTAPNRDEKSTFSPLPSKEHARSISQEAEDHRHDYNNAESENVTQELFSEFNVSNSNQELSQNQNSLDLIPPIGGTTPAAPCALAATDLEAADLFGSPAPGATSASIQDDKSENAGAIDLLALEEESNMAPRVPIPLSQHLEGASLRASRSGNSTPAEIRRARIEEMKESYSMRVSPTYGMSQESTELPELNPIPHRSFSRGFDSEEFALSLSRSRGGNRLGESGSFRGSLSSSGSQSLSYTQHLDEDELVGSQIVGELSQKTKKGSRKSSDVQSLSTFHISNRENSVEGEASRGVLDLSGTETAGPSRFRSKNFGMPIKTSIIREAMKDLDVDALYVPMSDIHFCEYVATHLNYVRWFSGFTGSAGSLLIFSDETAIAASDPRYSIQLSDEIDSDEWESFIISDGKKLRERVKQKAAEYFTKHSSNLVLGFDPSISDTNWYKIWKAIPHVTLKAVVFAQELPKQLQPPQGEGSRELVYSVERNTSRSFTQKSILLSNWIDSLVSDEVIDYPVVYPSSELDVVAWFLNIRGHDLKYMPVFFSHILFVAKSKQTLELTIFVQDEIVESIRELVAVEEVENLSITIRYQPYPTFISETENVLRSFDSSVSVISTPGAFSYHFTKVCEEIGAKIHSDKDRKVAFWMAEKDDKELQNTREVQKRDSRLIHMVLSDAKNGLFTGWTEKQLGEHLASERIAHAGALHESFEPIIGFGSNSASIHHRPDDSIISDGVLLIDNGGIYAGGTATDCTRTVWLGSMEPPAELVRVFTTVLRGHARLASATFPKNASGIALSTLAIAPLWEAGYTCVHGISHGVGVSVHEGPFSISGPVPRIGNRKTLVKGATISNEPGIYIPNKYGVRLENVYEVVECKMDDPQHENGVEAFCFNCLTWVPFDEKLIDRTIMTVAEVKWLDDYQKRANDLVNSE